MAEPVARRGGIYVIDLGADPVTGLARKRPALVVQNDQGNTAGATTIVVGLSSVVPSRLFPFHVHLPPEVLGRPGVIMCEHVKTVSLDRVDPHPLAECSAVVMAQVDEALRVSLGLA